MPKPIGPTVPRWQLGEELKRHREAAAISQADVAKRLECSVGKIQKIEGGWVGIGRAELEVMLAHLSVPEDEQENLLALAKLGKARGWWSKFGLLPLPFSRFLGLETAATSIRIYESLVVTGLCQTEDYARAHQATVTPKATPEMVEHQVRIRMERQKLIVGDDERPDMQVILDEAVIRRVMGSPAIMKAQLEHLLKLGRDGIISLHVVPFSVGGHPGTLGPLHIFEFPDNLHTPIGYAETQTGNHYLEDEKDLKRCTLAFNDIVGAALSKPESAKLIRKVIKELSSVAD